MARYERTATGKRRRLRSWLPISIVALLCAGFVVGAIAMQNSWWIDPTEHPAADQVAPDGMSLYGDAGMAYFTREGTLRVRLSPDSLPASTLGLDPSGNESFEPRVPISAVVLGADGAFRLDLVESFEVTTVGDLIQAIELNQVGNRAWTSVSGELEDLAESWGWSPADLDRLQDDLTQAARETSGAYSASLPQIEHNGALVSIEVTIEPDSNVNLSFSFSPLP